MKIRWAIALFLPLTLCFAAVESARYSFFIIAGAAYAPEAFKADHAGPFALPFVRIPRLKFHPKAEAPKYVLNSSLPRAVVRAALKVGKDGFVKDIKVLGSIPKELAETDGKPFFKRVVFY